MQHGSDWLADLVERDAQREARAARLQATMRHTLPYRSGSLDGIVRARRHNHPERTAVILPTPDNMR